MESKLIRIEFPCKYDAEENLIVGYASKETIDLDSDLIPAEVWFDALDTFFREGAPIKLLHRPSLVVGETVWLKIVNDGLILASRPIYPEIKGLVEKGLLRGYSIGYWPLEVEEKSNGVRVITKLKLAEISYVDTPANPECYFSEVKAMLRPDIEIHFDPTTGIVTAKGLTAEEMAKLAQLLGQSLESAGVKDLSAVKAIAFKMAEEEPSEEKEEALVEEKAPKWKLYRPGYEHARSLIQNGKISTDPWDAPDFEDFGNDIKTWRLFHLAYDPNGDRDNAGTYAYPYGKNGKVYYNALRAARQRASQFGLQDVYEAAGRLLEMARERLGKEKEEGEKSIGKEILDALKELVAVFGPEALPKAQKEDKEMENLEKEKEIREDEVKETQAPAEESSATEGKAEEARVDIEAKLAELEGLKELPEKFALQEKGMAELSAKVEKLEKAVAQIVEALSALTPKASSVPVVDTREGKEEKKGWGLGLDDWAKRHLKVA